MEFYDVAQILTTHGLKGEVKVKVITDFPEDRFKSGTKLYLKGSTTALTVQNGRPFKQFWLVQFAEVTEIAQAEKLRGKILTVSKEERGELAEGYYFDEILGCQVVDNQTGEKIGEIIDIEQPGANDIWQVKEENGKTFWLPFVDAFVKEVAVDQKMVKVELIEGLRDED
ncbi:ribosome maturation factor RimM [Lactobacillus corticis]|uniref:Ribosome maturation factor RimM n=1 Tax=Lactobacillus corticis TaxID=2201249 RepID=A0A916QHU0_9LACO|nr:ribosome maturation factor RimM [Lactobacillus corticis]GFZ27219.1 16S rRNA processing protein RimM [Lactobacillus corticis]